MKSSTAFTIHSIAVKVRRISKNTLLTMIFLTVFAVDLLTNFCLEIFPCNGPNGKYGECMCLLQICIADWIDSVKYSLGTGMDDLLHGLQQCTFTVSLQLISILLIVDRCSLSVIRVCLRVCCSLCACFLSFSWRAHIRVEY